MLSKRDQLSEKSCIRTWKAIRTALLRLTLFNVIFEHPFPNLYLAEYAKHLKKEKSTELNTEQAFVQGWIASLGFLMSSIKMLSGSEMTW